MRGTWESHYEETEYTGTLVIGFDTITITGFTEGQTPQNGDDTRRPFRNITRGVALSGYAEDGKIFITDAGILQVGIPYTYYTVPPQPILLSDDFLRFDFGGRQETMKKQ